MNSKMKLGVLSPLAVAAAVLVFGASQQVGASEKIVVVGDTTIYSAPNVENMTNLTLKNGQVVEVEDGAVATGFRKVRIKTKLGYVLDVDYQRWLTTGHDPVRASHRGSVWAGAIYSYLYEAARTATTDLNANYTISTFSGSTIFFAAGAAFQLSQRWSFLAGIVRRTLQLKGSATEQDTNTLTNYQVNQTFLGAEFAVHYRPEGWRNWQLEAQTEYSIGQSISLVTLGGPAIDTSAVKVGNYVLLLVGAEYEYRMSPHWSLTPRARVGAVLSTNPAILDGEVEADIKYYWQ